MSKGRKRKKVRDANADRASGPDHWVMRAAVLLLLAADFLSARPATAQARPDSGLHLAETLSLEARRQDTGEAYGWAISLLGAAVNIDGQLAATIAPLLGAIGMVVLSIAAGLDGGISAWTAARARRSADVFRGPDAVRTEQAELRHAISALYASAAGSMLGGVIPIAAMWIVDADALGRSDFGGRVPLGLFVPPGIVAGAGLLMLLVALGMDVTAGAWSGALSPSFSVLDGGALVSTTGRF